MRDSYVKWDYGLFLPYFKTMQLIGISVQLMGAQAKKKKPKNPQTDVVV